MRKKRVLVLMHVDLVPPDDIAGKPDEEVFEYKTEYDVVTGLRDLGHEVHPLGLYDDLTPLRQAIQNFKPHIAFNLLDNFRGEPMLEQNVVSYLELVQVPYTRCSRRGLTPPAHRRRTKQSLPSPAIGVAPPPGARPARTPRRRPARRGSPLPTNPRAEDPWGGPAGFSL